MLTKEQYELCVGLLKKELVPALGCTEPIAVAYAAACCRELLGCFPEHITVSSSGNIVKNVKGVIVPTTGDMRGIDTSAILGALAGDASLEMEVLGRVTPEDVEKVRALRSTGLCTLKVLDGIENLRIIVQMEGGGHEALVEIAGGHTSIVRQELDGQVMLSQAEKPGEEDAGYDGRQLSVETIYAFAKTVDLADIRPILERQVRLNMAIAEEGMADGYGARVGRTVLEMGQSVADKAAAYAAAGSDARMGGCAMPVVINSGSGNQGITASVPVVVFAREEGRTEEELFRALAFSNLIAIYQKSFIGKLSAYCGAVSAACGSATGIAFLEGAGMDVIQLTIDNTLGNVAGIVCDGAKASCAAKISSAVYAGQLGYRMAKQGFGFQEGEGLIGKDADQTIQTFGCVGRDGMRQTDEVILHMMVEERETSLQMC